MQCLMELDSSRFGLTFKEKLAYLGFKFAEVSAGPACPVTHIFEPGMYIREMFIPAGALFIGRPHNFGHRCELLSGKAMLVQEEAKTHVEAPAELWSKPGFMMCLYAKTDVIGRTYHPNPDERRDTDAMEGEIFGPIAELVELGRQVRAKIHAIEGKGALDD
jgi:hypothetical protein